MSFSRMRSAISHLLPRIYGHPFNQGWLKGTLPKNIFHSFLEQDVLYLRDFSEAFKLTSNRFSTHSHHAKEFKRLSEILNTESDRLLKDLNSTQSPRLFHSKKKSIEKNSTVSAYTQHHLTTARTSTVEEAAAAFSPCFWLYTHLSKKALSMPDYNTNNPYHSWIVSNSDNQAISALKLMIRLTEELANTTSCPIKKNNMVSAFVKSTEYEILFWDSIYQTMEKANELHSQHPFKAR